MKQEELADRLQRVQSGLKKKFKHVFEGITKAGNPTLLNEIYTDLYITEGGTGELNEEHEVRQIEAAFRKADRAEKSIRQEELFELPVGRQEPIRTVMTKGVAGIGKTVLTQKFTLDWAEGKANQNINYIFPFTFRELNVLKEKKFSLVELVHHFFPETKEAGICSFEDFQVIFIFDGLDECRLPLNFHKTQILTDPRKSTTVGDLLTNLIRGKLLSSARLWITTRPAAANQIPAECVDMVTEVRGFNEPQKEEYFRKRFRIKKQANRIISHIKTSRSLHIMCHIPVFCWITATVLEDLLKNTEGGELPKSLTEMYIHFLVVQAKVKKVKYDGGADTDPHWSPESRKMMESLGKLAFEQLQKGNLIFYESDLKECGIDIRAASVYSGVFTQIFREERGLYQDMVFCFIHLSVQEFLAALHVHLTFINSGANLMVNQQKTPIQFYQSAVKNALQSPNGHLDLFLRFLLGLSLQTNQSLLRGLLTQTGSSSLSNQETVQYIKKKISENLSADKSINLFHCLNELNDGSLVEEIQQSLRSGQFLLKSERSCAALSSILSSQSSSLRNLDLSNNNLQDSGMKLLSAGFKSPHCELETLSLSGCLITEEGCASLASALNSNPSYLRELDLSYNHPGEAGLMLLSAALEDPHKRLETLRYGELGIRAGIRTQVHFCHPRFDPNTVNRNLKLSENNKKVTFEKELQSYPDHPDRFDVCHQLLCRDGLTGRCYWEVEWTDFVYISVSYRGIRRIGDSHDCMFGFNSQSWSLICSYDRGYSVSHNNIETYISSSSSSSSSSHRVAVYVDWPAGTLSFFKVSSDSLIHLYTFNTTFTAPLYPGFGFRFLTCSSVVLC
uniref:NACHT domain-containing protein n=1 Tax=Oryzias latipes TaxID=8090 RepID=H2L3L3_ORYLA